MKKDNIMIAALSVGIVIVVAVAAVVLFQGTQKITDTGKTSATTAVVTAATTTAAQAAASTESASSQTTAATTAESTSKPTKKATETPAPTASPTQKPAVDDGSYNAYITAASTKAPDSKSQGTITFRLAQIYTGAEAIAQAKADGHSNIIEVDENGVEYISNDYYISDKSKKEISMPVLKDGSIRVIPTDGPDTASDDYCVDGTLKDLADNAKEYERFATITITGGYISNATEFYLP